MKDDEMKDIVEQSILRTSSQFTDNLMKRIVAESNLKEKSLKALKIACYSGAFIVLTLGLVRIPSFPHVAFAHPRIFVYGMQAILAMVYCFGIFKLVILRDSIGNKEMNT